MVSNTVNGRLIDSPQPSPVDVSTVDAQAVHRETAVDFHAVDVLHSLRRHGWLCVAIALPLSVTLAAAAYMLQSPMYRASSLLKVSSTANQLIFEGWNADTDFEIFQNTQQQLIRSRFVMNRALGAENLASSTVIQQQEDPVGWMVKNVQVSTPRKSEVMTISVESKQGEEAINIVNAVVDAYMAGVVNEGTVRHNERLSKITEVHNDKKSDLRLKRNKLKGFVEQLGSGDPQALSVIQQLQVQEIGNLRSQLIAIHSKIWNAEATMKILQVGSDVEDGETGAADAIANAPSEIEVDAAMLDDQIYSALLNDKLLAMRMHSETASAFKTEQPSVYGGMKQMIDDQLKERREQIRQELVATAPLRRRQREWEGELETQEQLRKLPVEIAQYKGIASRLESEVSELEEKFIQVGNQSIDVEMMRSEITQLDGLLASIAQEREELMVEVESPHRVAVVMPANEALVSNQLKRIALSGFAGIFGFAIPLASIMLLDLMSRRVNSSQSLSERTGLPIIGTVPVIPAKVIRRFPGASNRRSLFWQMRLTESVKRIAGRLVNRASDGEVQVLLVTSADRKEGKTTLATQLALSLAKIGRSVLLVDLDLRSPALHQVFGIDNSSGVCEMLRGETDLESAIKPTGTKNLQVLPAGERCGQALAALANGSSVPFFHELMSVADFIIIDGCPVLTSSDIGFICPRVDEVIFAVRRDVSRTNDVKVAVDVISNAGKPITGAVVVEPDEARHVNKADLMTEV